MTAKDLTEVAHWVNVLRDARKKMKRYKDLEAVAKEQIAEHMGDAEEGTLQGYPVLTYTRSTSRRLSATKVRQLHPEIANECTEESITETLKLVNE